MINFFTIFCLLNSIICLSVGVFAYVKRKEADINKRWFILSISVTIWNFGYFLTLIAPTKQFALISSRFLLYGGSIFIVPSYLHFIISFLEIKKNKFLKPAYLIALFLFFIGIFTPFLIKDMSPKLNFKYYSEPGFLYCVFLLFFSMYIVYAFALMFKRFNSLSPHGRNQLRYIILASLIGFGGGFTNYPLIYNVPIFPFGQPFVVFYPVIITYAIIKYRLMDIRIFISKAVAFLMSYPFLLGVPFFFAYRMRPVLYPLFGLHWWLAPSGLIVFLATLAPLAYEQLKRRMEGVLLAEQKRYQRLLMQAAQGMVKVKDLKHLINLIVHIVTKAVRVDMAAIFRFDQENECYKLEAYRDRGLFKEEVAIPKDHPLINHLLKKHEPLLLEDIPFVVKSRSSSREVASIFGKFKINLIIPSFGEKDLLGFLALGSKPNNQVYTQDDINVFQILSNQASLAIENCIFLEEFKKTQEKIFRADKLATIGAMAEGVSHQMNNRLQAFAAIAGDLKDVVQEALKINKDKKIKENLDYCAYGLEKVEKNVIQSAQIIRGILNYARTEKDASFRFFDIREVINVAVDLLGAKHSLKGFTPTVKSPDKIPEVYGSVAQLSEAVFNLIDNAYEAIEDRETTLRVKGSTETVKKKITIEIQPLQASLLLKVRDNGIGIKKENHAKMFAPFYTTKSSAKSGTGLGMYVIKRIIAENHKGSIWFESEYMKGSCFYVELPITKKV